MIDQVISDGRYRVGRLVGRGGMAHVRLGLDVQTGRAVAVKYLLEEFLANEPARRLFAAEAMADVDHPSVVRVLDSGEAHDLDSGATVPYLVMDFVPGTTLRSLLREGTMDVDRALDLSVQLLTALAHCHAVGLVHRDIKPSNIMVTPSERVRLLDFGVARRIGPVSDPTNEISCFASTAYASPEQVQRLPADGRSDLYSAGCVLYEMLTGRPPFAPTSPEALPLRLVEDLRPPSRHNPEVGPDLDALVLRSLRRDPDERHPSAEVMISDLEVVRRSRQAPAVSPVLLPVPPAPVEPRWSWTPGKAVGRPPRRTPRRRMLTLTSGVAAALLPVAGFGMLHLRGLDVADGGAVAATLVAGPGPVGERTALSVSGQSSEGQALKGTGSLLIAPSRLGEVATVIIVPEPGRAASGASTAQARPRLGVPTTIGAKPGLAEPKASAPKHHASKPPARAGKPKVDRPTPPKADRPKPPAPKPNEPKPNEPKPSTPEPSTPKPDKPKPTVPKAGKPKPGTPKPRKPKPPKANGPKSTAPKPVKTEPVKTKPVKTKPVKTKPNKTKPNKPATPKPAKPRPKPAKPTPNKPESGTPDKPTPDKPMPDKSSSDKPDKPKPKGAAGR